MKGKRAIVTGGSKGIGLEVARLLAAEGATVLICARRESVLQEAVHDIQNTTGAGKFVQTLSVDVTKIADIDRLARFARERLQRVDILINNAGTGTYKPFLEVTDEELIDGMAINFFAQFRICQRIVPLMLQSGGSIVNISGETGIRVTQAPFLSSCTGPAKSAEIRFSKVLASELGPLGIRVNCVVPGLVLTPERFAKWEREMVKAPLSTDEAEDVRKEWAKNVALPGSRWGTPEELARFIVFVASGVVPYLNGAALVVDGGEDKS